MKFGASLNDGLVPEWKAQYVDYKKGKKLIHICSDLKAKEASKAAEVSGPPPTSLSSTIPPSSSVTSKTSPTKPLSSNYTPSDPEQRDKTKDNRTRSFSQGTRLNTPKNDRTPLLSPIDEDSRIEVNLLDQESGKYKYYTAPPSTVGTSGIPETDLGKGQLKPRFKISPDTSSQLSLARNNNNNNDDKNSSKKLYDDEETPTGSSELIRFRLRNAFRKDLILSENPTKLFYDWANEELKKVDSFYLEKELESYERFLLLQDQIYQLRDHKLFIINRRVLKIPPQMLDGSGATLDQFQTIDPDILNKPGISSFRSLYNLVVANLDGFEYPSLPLMAFMKKWKSHKGNDKVEILLQKRNTNEESFDPAYEENKIRNGVITLQQEQDSDDGSYRGTIGDMEDEERSLRDQNELIDSASTTSRKPAKMETPLQLAFLNILDEDPSSSKRNQVDIESRRRNRMDYTKKLQLKTEYRIPYLYAKKHLKHALLEHYRSLTLLKSYKIMNKTALRKITKKFDKAMSQYGKEKTHFMDNFMEKVDKAYFETSDMIDKLLIQVEELYLLFFDNGNDRKLLLEKLRSIAYVMKGNGGDANAIGNQLDYYKSVFCSGLFLGFGLPLFILAIYTGVNKTLSGELLEGQFLLQIWGGFFLITLILFLFGVNTIAFEKFKINYKFIFEFNLATCLNYHQYLFLPSFAFGCLSLLMWFSLHNFWPVQFPGRDWPWIFFAGLIIIFLWPGREFYGPSRRWLQVALWRLLLSGFYPVEFRDFFLGDILSSLTYTMGNISFFFCLYSHHWNGLLGNLPKHNVCGSSKSRLMGFFSTLPSIWRFLQCLRRYLDTGDAFPHIANMLKYTCAILYAALLSVYRIESTANHKVAFIVFASINSIYVSLWDIFMDWSLLQSGSKHFLLRDNIFYKNPIYYYIAMVLDVLLRFLWIFYAVFSKQIQQLAVTSFLIAVAEVFRRFIWIFFRMENEHCSNVILFRASKESPLPYPVKWKVEQAVKKLVRIRYEQSRQLNEDVIMQQPEEGDPTTTAFKRIEEESEIGLSKKFTNSTFGAKLKRKSTFVSLSSALNKAHIKDFQRRKAIVQINDDSDDDDDMISVVSKDDK